MANNRLPFGLCKKYGIELPKGATPRDAWAALDKIPADEFKKPLMIKIPMNFFSEKGIKNLAPNEIKKGIKTLNIRLNEHLKKIENPELYCKDWNTMSYARKNGLINFWKKECNNLNNGIQERLKRLEEMGEHYEKDD